jgi:hypothetical protein
MSDSEARIIVGNLVCKHSELKDNRADLKIA